MIEVLQMILAGKCSGNAIDCTAPTISVNFDSNRKKGDYKKRGGLTSRPLTVKNFNEAPRILHLRLRSATWIEGLLIRLKAKHYQWGAGKPITDAQKKRLDKAEERMKVSAHFKSKTIAFLTGQSVAHFVHLLALLTPLTRSQCFAMLRSRRSLALLTRLLTHFAHSLMEQLKLLNMYSFCKLVLREKKRF